MRDLRRNRQRIYYALFEGEEALQDGSGNKTGESKARYSAPASAMLNISPAIGEEAAQMFGGFSDYTHTIATARPFPLDESSIVWIGREPNEPHNFTVVRVAHSLNGSLYALRAVAGHG